MEAGEWIGISVSLATLLIAIFGMGLVLIQKMDSQSQRLESKIEAGDAETRVEVRRVEAEVRRVEAEVKGLRETLDSRLNGVEQTQARHDGIISVLSQRGGEDTPRES
jgi:uncharacterized protein YlxW (UPF0749 family)